MGNVIFGVLWTISFAALWFSVLTLYEKNERLVDGLKTLDERVWMLENQLESSNRN